MAITGNLITLGIGATLMYLLDPREGKRRRAVLRDQGLHVGKLEKSLLGKAARDLSNRAHGLAERVRHPIDRNVPDEIIADRVRARLGRVVSHPGAIEVGVTSCRVVLWGPILAGERDRCVREIGKVPGVREVIDRLEAHEQAGDIPALQGQGHLPGRPRAMWGPAARAAAIAGGGALLASGLVRPGGTGALLRILGGGALLVRGVWNQPLRGPVTIQKTLTVDAPVELVFAVWSRPESFPRFMQHVRSVEVSDGGRRSHWRVDGPAGAPVAFEAELTRMIADRIVSWRTLPGQTIEHEGTVHFEPANGATRVHVEMRYEPPGGALAHAVARLFGWDPRKRMDEDLIRMKGLLETGHTRAHGTRVSVAEVLPPPL